MSLGRAAPWIRIPPREKYPVGRGANGNHVVGKRKALPYSGIECNQQQITGVECGGDGVVVKLAGEPPSRHTFDLDGHHLGDGPDSADTDVGRGGARWSGEQHVSHATSVCQTARYRTQLFC